MVNPLECTIVTSTCTVKTSIYGYKPNIPTTVFFIAFFATCTILNLIFGIRYRTWTYMIAVGLGSLAETIGYIGRLYVNKNPFNFTAFEVSLCCITIAPAFTAAAVYLTLKHITLCFGAAFAHLKPTLYTYLFILADVLALVLQAIGGGMAASARGNPGLAERGNNLLMAGISWQVITLLIFGVMISLYIHRRHAAVHTCPLSTEAIAVLSGTKFRLFGIGLVLAFLSIFTRCVYRIVEMAGGWKNPVMRNEPLFIALDSCMISLATLCLTAFHPGYCFPRLRNTVWTTGKKQTSGEIEGGRAGRSVNKDEAKTVMG